MLSLPQSVTLSINRALIGEVFDELVAVICDIRGARCFAIKFVVDPSFYVSDIEDLSSIVAEVIADFPDDFEITDEIILFNKFSWHDLATDEFFIFKRRDRDCNE